MTSTRRRAPRRGYQKRYRRGTTELGSGSSTLLRAPGGLPWTTYFLACLAAASGRLPWYRQLEPALFNPWQRFDNRGHSTQWEALLPANLPPFSIEALEAACWTVTGLCPRRGEGGTNLPPSHARWHFAFAHYVANSSPRPLHHVVLPE
ncbi:hypothetical protein GQ53DRAFT_34504 [Thozetella sp. PMI_491]|nr:hypothetical protein GQ53DRAFT_34504 [Thozetella sp. PMI_491]